MRTSVRTTLSALTAAAVLIGGISAANADPKHPYPSQAQVDAAKKAAAEKAQSVAQIRAALVVAQQQADAANTAAEVAAERYNGAVWALQKARKEAVQARADATRALADVATQRDEIARLAAASYQQGTDLNALTAVLSSDGATGLMNKIGVVQSAGDSMQARYQKFQAVSALAKVYADKARKAEARQKQLATQARQARDEAAALASSAQSQAAQVAQQRDQLIQELAKAQHVSVALAKQRQDALERIAREKAAAAARAKALAEQRAAAAAAKKAAQQAAQQASSTNTPAAPAPATQPRPPVLNPPHVSRPRVQKVIDYAFAQLGKPYVWAAAGPDSFDCSGLTMMAWRQGGVYLAHYAESQYYQSTPISYSQLRPGDLVFWTVGDVPTGYIHHVALYIGHGKIIQAPRTGAYVEVSRLDSLYDPPTLFGRP
ncbi:MAG TPA: C40 family peptidase [Marmoricola sp.]|nr:C40 family peptidase [Marmoricola sp.]